MVRVPRETKLDPGFLVSLGCSCLVHALILFLPLFGTIVTSTTHGSPNTPKTWSGISVTFNTHSSIDGSTIPQPQESVFSAEPANSEPPFKPGEKSVSAPSRMDQADLLPVPGIIYYPTSFLTTRPQPLAKADLDPGAIRYIVASGKIIMTLWINPLGETNRVMIESSNLPPSFSRAAEAAFMQLRFTPGELYGNAVGAVMRIEITYDDGRLLQTEIVK